MDTLYVVEGGDELFSVCDHQTSRPSFNKVFNTLRKAQQFLYISLSICFYNRVVDPSGVNPDHDPNLEK